MMIRSLVVCAGVALLAGCGVPKVGDSCTSGAICEDADTALECRSGLLRAVACKGPAGCVDDDQRAVCDTTGNIAGDGCFASQEDLGQCSAADPKELLQCQNGKWVVLETCANACSESGGQVSCT